MKIDDESPLVIGLSPGTPVKKIEKKYPFHPLEEHRPWCSWITELVFDPEGDTTASTDKGTSLDMSGYNTDRTSHTLLGYQLFIHQIYEVLDLVSEPQWSNSKKYCQNLEGIRNIRTMLYDSWTASEATTTDNEDIAEK